MAKKINRIVRRATPEELAEHAVVRENIMQEFPPAEPSIQPATNGIGYQVRTTREAEGLTRFALAEKAGIENSGIVRDLEFGQEVSLSEIRQIAKSLGLELALVEVSQEAS